MRIPRFPIGAVLRQDAEAHEREKASQLALPLADRTGSTDITTGAEAGTTPAESHHAPAQAREEANAPWAAVRREAPRWPGIHWDELPVALAEASRLRAVTVASARHGVRAGMTLAEARARCASLDVRVWDGSAITREALRTTAALLVASPQVTPVAGAPGLWWVGASGFDELGGERNLARTLLRIARLWHPRARVAIANSCVAARAATWSNEQESPIMVIPHGGDATFLSAAPLSLIPMEDDLRESLLALGLRTAGAFAALEPGDVESRWGATGLAAWRLTRGEDRRRPVLARSEARRSVSVELPASVQTLDPLVFLLRAALDRLVRELVRDGRAAASVAITLQMDDGLDSLLPGGMSRTVTREARPARPLARTAPLLERCRLLLDSWRLDAPVAGMTVSIPATAPLAAEQGDLLAPAWHDPDTLETALERLRLELGNDVVVRPVAYDTHRPDRAGGWEVRAAFRVQASKVSERPDAPGGADVRSQRNATAPTATPGRGVASTSATSGAHGQRGANAPVATRLLEPPEPATVTCDGVVPVTLRWRNHYLTVNRATGPERLSGEWWKGGFARDYWRCETTQGALTLFRDRMRGGSWWVSGWED